MLKGKLVDPVIKALVNNNAIDRFEDNMMPFKRLMAYYKCAIMEVETKFKVLNQEFSLEYDRNPIETIKTRLKSTDSIVKKLAKRDLPLTVESIEKNLNDIAGVRVICSFPEDIYVLADCLLQQDDIKLIQVKDYIKNPKPNGYRSLHLIVEIPIFLKDTKKNMRVEVQLRTIAMDFWASLDHKLSYKKDIPEEEEELLRQELLECAQISADLDKRMEKIKNRIVNNKI
ncbi:GTP pyrophosphokinase [Intestinibacter bartlettii]|uniref:GTP pyrophosphokinase family protein n=1 Tax=Intestinibacter bartlettii TaxID=261299 RepID=A0ABS6DZX6_9FIRM|nr:GTP pyrophosphokinase family protein [Intestinibacter bartlettii]MBU5337295.1 GTP pyrophosphokinase family protein [Intestinibacter bartlettii]MDO5010447.1 GTP pyrophosphokinase family protein [Intestinibacter bartlettii]